MHKTFLGLKFFSLHKTVLDDNDLLEKYKQTGNISYFSQLYERYIPLVYGLCLRYLQNADKSQDAVIDIFENLSGKIIGYEIKSFKNWLYSVVKNHCFYVLRENKKETIVSFDSQFMESEDILDLLIEESDKEKEMHLNNCIQKLPSPQRIAIQKFFFEDKSYADIVDETGYNLKSVKSYIQNGKRNLKICIEKALKL